MYTSNVTVMSDIITIIHLESVSQSSARHKRGQIVLKARRSGGECDDPFMKLLLLIMIRVALTCVKSDGIVL